MWFVFEVDGKIKDGELFGPFNSLADAEAFKADRPGDHAVTQAINPAAARVVAQFKQMSQRDVRVVVGGKAYVGEMVHAEIDSSSSSCVRVWLDIDGKGREISIHVGQPFSLAAA